MSVLRVNTPLVCGISYFVLGRSNLIEEWDLYREVVCTDDGWGGLHNPNLVMNWRYAKDAIPGWIGFPRGEIDWDCEIIRPEKLK